MDDTHVTTDEAMSGALPRNARAQCDLVSASRCRKHLNRPISRYVISNRRQSLKNSLADSEIELEAAPRYSAFKSSATFSLCSEMSSMIVTYTEVLCSLPICSARLFQCCSILSAFARGQVLSTSAACIWHANVTTNNVLSGTFSYIHVQIYFKSKAYSEKCTLLH